MPTAEVLDQFFVGDLVCLKSKAYSVGTVTRYSSPIFQLEVTY